MIRSAAQTSRLLILEAPGMAKDDFELQVTDGYLVVCGEKRVEREESKGR